jgi:hypothetical protein
MSRRRPQAIAAERSLSDANLEALADNSWHQDFQTIGLLCREVLISLGQAIYDPAVHTTEDGVAPSKTDGGRMIEAFLRTAASGGSNENVRKHARAALSLAVELQHKRTADVRGAMPRYSMSSRDSLKTG